jgi:hypothetical protein
MMHSRPRRRNLAAAGESTDEDAAIDGDLRVVDESGEDYLYSAEYFVFVDLPRSVEKSLLRAA